MLLAEPEQAQRLGRKVCLGINQCGLLTPDWRGPPFPESLGMTPGHWHNLRLESRPQEHLRGHFLSAQQNGASALENKGGYSPAHLQLGAQIHSTPTIWAGTDFAETCH